MADIITLYYMLILQAEYTKQLEKLVATQDSTIITQQSTIDKLFASHDKMFERVKKLMGEKDK